MNMTDPSNQFIRQLTLGGAEGMKELQKKQIWESIAQKYEGSNDSNEFLNKLTQDEFAEYITERPYDFGDGKSSLHETGKKSIDVRYGVTEKQI